MDEKSDNIFKTLLTTIIIIVVIAILTFFITSHFGKSVNLWQTVTGGNRYVELPDPTYMPVLKGEQRTIGLDRILYLRQLLETEEYEKLNMELEKYRDQSKQVPSNDYIIFDAYEAISITDPDYEGLIQDWIIAFPETYQPYLAMGRYYYAKGWESRGTAWRKDTSDEQIDGMRLYFSLSEENITHALQIDSDLAVAYGVLIGIYNAGGNNASENAVIRKSIEKFPYSYSIRNFAIWAKQPRWGGSYAEMSEIAKEAEDYSDINPMLTMLYGGICYDQGRVLERNEKYEEAIALFQKALSYGDRWAYYYEIARTNYAGLQDYDAALEAVNESIWLRPTVSDNYLLRSKIYFRMESYENSLKDLEYAETIDPWDDDIISWRMRASDLLVKQAFDLFNTDRAQAIDKYNLALYYDDENYEAYYWKSVSYLKIEETDSAFSAANRAIYINPHHFESYRIIDAILARDEDWDKIIEYWDRFLELEPDNADAYYERSGTYYHKNDMENAMADLEMACNLGNSDACKRFKAMTK